MSKKDNDRYPNYGVGAQTRFDATNNTYIHSATFQLTQDVLNENIVTFAPGKYVFQVHSGSVRNGNVISEVIPINF